MAYADDLLEQAEHLAKREKNKPRQASLRRAVSTAYYALFHLLIAEAALNWKQTHQRHLFARSFEHARMKQASESQTKELSRHSEHSNPPGFAISQQLLEVASSFVELQSKRHTADYDNAEIWTRTEALEQVDAATRAFQSWKAIRNEPAAQDYLFSLMLKKR